jgi:hypothetical protein
MRSWCVIQAWADGERSGKCACAIASRPNTRMLASCVRLYYQFYRVDGPFLTCRSPTPILPQVSGLVAGSRHRLGRMASAAAFV